MNQASGYPVGVSYRCFSGCRDAGAVEVDSPLTAASLRLLLSSPKCSRFLRPLRACSYLDSLSLVAQPALCR